MARRSAPPNSGPAYYSRSAVTHGGIDGIDGDQSAFSQFMNREIWALEKLPGNFAIVTSIVVFTAGVTAVRTFGEMLIP